MSERICDVYRRTGRVSEQDLQGATVEELLILKGLVDLDTGHIERQLREARSHQAATGQYADRAWYDAATNARAAKGRLGQTIQTQIALRKQVRRSANHAQVNNNEFARLLAAMKAVLSAEQVEAVLAVWRNRQDS